MLVNLAENRLESLQSQMSCRSKFGGHRNKTDFGEKSLDGTDETNRGRVRAVLSVWQRHGTRSIRGFLEAAESSNRVGPNTRLFQRDQMGHFAIEFDSSATFFEFIHLNRK